MIQSRLEDREIYNHRIHFPNKQICQCLELCLGTLYHCLVCYLPRIWAMALCPVAYEILHLHSLKLRQAWWSKHREARTFSFEMC